MNYVLHYNWQNKKINFILFFFLLPPLDDGSEVLLKKGEVVKVVRASEKRGYLVIEHRGATVHLPFQVMELKVRV